MKTINIGLLAHVDAGKTTTAEQLMYVTGAIKELGNVNKGSSTLDYNDIEKQRGITVFSEQAELIWKDQRINIIDTPGHVDFAPEMERMLSILDGAILIISAAEGIQAHTETIWYMLRENDIPTIVFINKMDRIGIEMDALIRDLQRLDNNLLSIQHYKGIGESFQGIESLIDGLRIYDELVEPIIESDERLLEKYLEEVKIQDKELAGSLKKSIKERKIIPVLYGCASRGIGINELLDAMSNLFSPYEPVHQLEQFSGLVYKIKMHQQLGKLNYVKVLSGSLRIRDTITIDDEDYKVTSLRKFSGNKASLVDELVVGEIGAITGIKDLKIGQVIGEKVDYMNDWNIEPVLGTRVLYENDQKNEVVKLLDILNEEDPSLNFQYDSQRKVLQIAIMGMIHMEVLKEHIQNRFHITVDFEKPFVHYKETVTDKSTGFCHFEPKKHFAEVEVEIEPNETGKGIQYVSKYSVDYLPVQYQKVIEQNIPVALKHGVLLGAPVTDVKVHLIAGQHHLEHTHGGDFRMATIRAIQQALTKNNIQILEPYYAFRVIATQELSGKIMSDFLQMKGQLDATEQIDDKAIIKGIVPIATSMDYPIKLASLTGGRGIIQYKFHSYQPCHNSDEVITDEANVIERDEKLYNSITILREKKKMKKVVMTDEVSYDN
ncbi:GTP-binding protein [Vallitalea okinawensis]|uniref:GTP-binding protein n=1 Tax=Vallitalea okinawensis TaxID=2078660 RepID=UPI000CFD24F4|nr:TetM/TetW/TetO/TetS family tetracycline resistance ribosomal protection protein [Vallitalea okinawensis]